MTTQASEIIMLDGLTILYKSSVDLFFYVMGSSYENELLLMSALDVLFDSLNIILKKEFEKKALMEHLDMVMMAVDEICDQGILLEHDPEVFFRTKTKQILKAIVEQVVVSRVTVRSYDDLPLGEQTVAHVQAKLQVHSFTLASIQPNPFNLNHPHSHFSLQKLILLKLLPPIDSI